MIGTTARPVTGTMRILIIEDNSDIVANLFGFFEPKGHHLDAAANGYAGLALAREHRYDVIVLDVMMPGMNGMEMCRKLRAELLDNTPVLEMWAVSELLRYLKRVAEDVLARREDEPTMLRALDHLCEVDDSGILVAAEILLTVAEERLAKKVVVVEDLFRHRLEELSALSSDEYS